jgi:TRAP-type C4-dicarboxylate transport system substrate-binding protein
MTIKKIAALALPVILMASTAAVQAAEVVLRLHQMLPPQATIPSKVLEPWAEKVTKESGGKLAVELYPSMQLGGKPPELLDQARDGVVDLVWTLFGYTPGRYPKTEAFELPFMVTSATATSMAFHEYYETQMRKDKELRGLHILAVHTHGPGLLHTRDKVINKLEDMDGLKLRGTSRVINELLSSLGASPIGMPVPAVPEALSKGVIDGTVIPFEVAPPLKIPELAPNHTEFSGKYGLYTGTFVFAMNKESYRSLPADLRQVIDNNSGIELAKLFGQAMDNGDVRGRQLSDKAGNTTVKLDETETARWREVSDKVTKGWIAEMDKKGLNGSELYKTAKALIEKYDAAK